MRSEKLKELRRIIDELKVLTIEKQDKECRFIGGEVYKCTLNNGEVIYREKLIKSGGDGSAAVVLPVTRDKNVILTVEPRVFSKRGVGISIPAGYIEKGESGILAAQRELMEETGYTSTNIVPLKGFYQDIGCSSSYNELFVAMNCYRAGSQSLDESEYVKCFECSYDEAFELMDMGYIEDSNAIITLLRSKKYIK